MTSLPEPTSHPVQRHRTTTSGGVCEPDPLDPDRMPCSNPVVLDDRQGISHFLGRNKRPTSTIPTKCYPLQCRVHYQEGKYRRKDTPGAEAAAQCDAIALTISRMSKETWYDAATDTTWPRWSGYELQLSKASEMASSNLAEGRAITQFSSPGTPAPERGTPSTKLRKQKPPAPVPDWLAALCTRPADSTTPPSYAPVGDRHGIRYSASQLIRIVRGIKTWCIQTDSRLPGVEALPVTLGLAFEAELSVAKAQLDEVSRKYNVAAKEVRDAKAKGRSEEALEALESRATIWEQHVEEAKHTLETIKADLESVRATLPAKRRARTTSREASAGAGAPAEDDDIVMGDVDITPLAADGGESMEDENDAAALRRAKKGKARATSATATPRRTPRRTTKKAKRAGRGVESDTDTDGGY
jgi:hypothetical protein